MKKILLITVVLLSSCGPVETNSPDQTCTVNNIIIISQPSPTPQETTEPTPEPTIEPSPSPSPSEEPSPSPSTNEPDDVSCTKKHGHVKIKINKHKKIDIVVDTNNCKEDD